jgi:hypothetical protein
MSELSEKYWHAGWFIDLGKGAYDRNHTQACELSEMDGGLMDHYVVPSLTGIDVP